MSSLPWPRIHVDADGVLGTPSAAVMTKDDVWVFEIPPDTDNVVSAVVAAAREAGFHVEHLHWNGAEYVGTVCLIDTETKDQPRRRWWQRSKKGAQTS